MADAGRMIFLGFAKAPLAVPIIRTLELCSCVRRK
jgi:hypothetical protein